MRRYLLNDVRIASWLSGKKTRFFGADFRVGQARTMHNGLALVLEGGQPVMPGIDDRRRSVLTCKRLMDIAISAIALVLLSPVFGLIALAVKASSAGPVLFRQKRVGYLGREFSILKYRTMWQDSCDHAGLLQTRLNDQRLTGIGRLLRRTNLDELPQLINVLLGDMSLVGPRPHVAKQLAADKPYKKVVAYYDHRLLMTPGLTGWAQANGLRGPTTEIGLARSRVDHDLAYIQNFSLWLDVKIIWRTICREVFRCTGY